MAKKQPNKTETQLPDVTLRNGKWVTYDGLCFNTATKAWNHVKEKREAEQEPAEPEQTKNQNE